ncbi:MAG: nuclear transport factor 2 family protein [Acidobacteria bacterium]|nr:nuclear transport factor 2 family protein [Acidobacteriota bacterium]
MRFGLLFACAVALLTTTVAAPRALADGREADRKAIRDHIDAVFQAYIKKDRATIQATHAKEWRGFLTASRGIIRGIDQYMQAADGFLQSPVRLSSYQMRDFDVFFYGDLAVVPYIADLEGRAGEQPFSSTLRVLDIYARQHGHWNQVASDVANHPDTIAAQRQQPFTLPAEQRRELLAAREAVWRAYFASDVEHLDKVIPAETIAINAGEVPWADRQSVLSSAAGFAASGGKLLKLEFPRTEIQTYGDVAILYTTWTYTVEVEGKEQTASGRGTEIFVRRDGRWVNSGWHLDSGK